MARHSKVERLFQWFGSKDSFAHKYDPPGFDTIIEPFAGSAAYARFHWRKKVILYDLDERVIAAWKYLIAADPKRILALPDMREGEPVSGLQGVCEEERWVIATWLQPSATDNNVLGGWALSHNLERNSSYWGAARRRAIARSLPKIRHWQVHHASYDTIPQQRATWFVDPPYEDKGKHYKHGSVGMDFAALGEWCRAREGQVIVCENAGATWLPFTHIHTVGIGTARTSSTEVVWRGGEVFGQANLFGETL